MATFAVVRVGRDHAHAVGAREDRSLRRHRIAHGHTAASRAPRRVLSSSAFATNKARPNSITPNSTHEQHGADDRELDRRRYLSDRRRITAEPSLRRSR